MIVWVCFCFLGSATLGDDDPRIARDDAFPSPDAGTYIAGELTHVDHVNRTGILRPDRKSTDPKPRWDLPHPFELPPYAIVRYHGAPAELRDIPLGTHLHGSFYLGANGDYKLVQPRYPAKPSVANQSPFHRAVWLEDDFSFYQRQAAGWKVIRLDSDANELTVERVALRKGAVDSADRIRLGMLGQKQFRIEPATRIWKGRGIARQEDILPGQIVQLNLSWVTLLGTTYKAAVTETADDGLCREIWIDEESRGVAERTAAADPHRLA